MYWTEVGPFSLEKGGWHCFSWELCSKLRLQCWWLKGSVSLSSAVFLCRFFCFRVGCFGVFWGFFVVFGFFFLCSAAVKGEKYPTLYLIYGRCTLSDQLKALWNLSLHGVVITPINLLGVKYAGGMEIKSHFTTMTEEHKLTTRKYKLEIRRTMGGAIVIEVIFTKCCCS